MDIKIGDIVVLKSGGPLMTVADIGDYSFGGGGENQAKCIWFEKTKKFEDVFPLETLTIYTK
jgi:uncharacterized protein YodC (DUF2158 family)